MQGVFEFLKIAGLFIIGLFIRDAGKKAERLDNAGKTIEISEEKQKLQDGAAKAGRADINDILRD